MFSTGNFVQAPTYICVSIQHLTNQLLSKVTTLSVKLPGFYEKAGDRTRRLELVVEVSVLVDNYEEPDFC